MSNAYWNATTGRLARVAYRVRMGAQYVLTQRRPATVAFILTLGRTGSNLLLSYLNSVDGVGMKGEVLNPNVRVGLPRANLSRQAVLRFLEKSVATSGPVIGGCKLMVYQLRQRGIAYTDLRALFPEARFLILYRESILDQYLSQLRAQATGRWMQRSTDVTTHQSLIHFDCDQYKAYARRARSRFREMAADEWVSCCGLLVKYEDLRQTPEHVFSDCIFPFLGLPDSRIATPLAKQNRSRWQDLIANYDQVGPFLHDEANGEDFRLGDALMRGLFPRTPVARNGLSSHDRCPPGGR